MYKEAHLLALQIESRRWAARAAGPQDAASQDDVERFIQESKLKVNLFEKENKTRKSPNSLKRETYYLSDSPLGGPQLLGTPPPSDQGPPSAPAQTGATRTQGPPLAPRSLPVEPGPVRPPTLAVTQRKVVSKLQPPRASSSASSSARGKSTRVAVAVEEVGRAGRAPTPPASPSRVSRSRRPSRGETRSGVHSSGEQ